MSSQRWLKLTLAYDGTRYAGWQRQPHLPTIQSELEQAWQAITGEAPTLTASGRTDAGVHAAGQVVGLATSSLLAEGRLLRGLNAKLPEDIVVREVAPAPPGFHATHDALKKLYRYQIHNSRVRPLFERRYVWHYPQPLDLGAMQLAAQLLIGRHDFACFETTGSERSSTVRTLTQVTVQPAAATGEAVPDEAVPDEAAGQGGAGERLWIDVEGDGFLYNMVRAITGTLVEVGRGARQPGWVRQVLASQSRKAAGPNAPAQGLMLMRVDYAIPFGTTSFGATSFGTAGE